MNEQEIKDLQYETIDRLQKRIKELEELLSEAHDYILMGLTPTADILQRIRDTINISRGEDR